MIIEELTFLECHAMLQRAEIARLACAVDNQPYIVPINVDFGDGCLYGYSTMGQKINWMRVNPLVCLEIEEFTGHKLWATLVCLGPVMRSFQIHPKTRVRKKVERSVSFNGVQCGGSPRRFRLSTIRRVTRSVRYSG